MYLYYCVHSKAHYFSTNFQLTEMKRLRLRYVFPCAVQIVRKFANFAKLYIFPVLCMQHFAATNYAIFQVTVVIARFRSA